MRFPKIKYTELSELAITLPFLALLIVGWILCLLPGILSSSIFIGILAPILYSFGLLWLLQRPENVMHDLDATFYKIRLYQRSCPEYLSHCNGLGRDAVTHALLSRAKWFGKSAVVGQGSVQPICLRHRHHSTPGSNQYTALETYLAIYAQETLEKSSYEQILADARERFRAIPDPPMSPINGPSWVIRRGRLGLVIVLADTVSDEVRQLALVREQPSKTEMLLPCVVECSSGKYYVNLESDPYRSREQPVPMETMAANLAIGLVFGNRMPRGSQPGAPFELDLEQSVWELIRFLQRSRDEAFGGSYRRALKLLRQMQNDAVHLTPGVLYCKRNDMLVACPCLAEDNRLTLRMGTRWLILPENIWAVSMKIPRADSQQFMQEYAFQLQQRSQITEEESLETRQQIEKCLVENGYCVRWDA